MRRLLNMDCDESNEDVQKNKNDDDYLKEGRMKGKKERS